MRIRRVHVNRPTFDHELIWGWIGVFCFSAGIVWINLFDHLFIPCQFHALTGLPCISCGSTRAFIAFVHGNIWQSLRFNPLASCFYVFALGYVPYALAAVYLRLPRIRIEWSRRDWIWIRWTLPMLGIGVWIFLIIDGR